MEINLYPHQQDFYDNILEALSEYDKVCCVLPTGGGKSVVIGKLANNLKGRTLVLTHRIEILTQNSDWLKDVGMLSSNINTLRYDNEIVIAMVQTLHARMKEYGNDYLGQFDNIILDETHILIFEKVFEKYDYKKLIGFTATPTTNKLKYFEIDGVEFVEPYTLSEIYDTIVEGPSVKELIELGYLVQDYNIKLNLPDFDKLRESKTNPDGYTSKSLNEVYENTASLKILTDAYEKYCKGKKVLIFNATNKVNKFVYDHFKKIGLNAKMFDTSKHKEINPDTGKKYKRDEIIEWFKNERDAILINTNVFTTGFNVTDVEVVLVNRATKSLSLWIQMVGRGSRTTDVIFKNMFTVIDLGQNINEHGTWSSDINWEDHFYSPGPRRKNSIDLLSTWDCEYCGSINVKGETVCEYCGADKLNAVISNETKKKKEKEGKFEIIKDIPPPKGNQIVKYAKAKGEDISFCFNLAEQKILDLFVHYRVSNSFYKRRKIDFDARVKQIFTPIYFAVLKSDLPGSKKRKLDTITDRIIQKVEKQMKYASSKK